VAYTRTGRPRGRRPIFDKAMTDAERKKRSRWMQAVIGKMIDRHRTRVQANFMRDGEAQVVADMLAYACFDLKRHLPNYERWEQISEQVLQSFARLQDDFIQFRDNSDTELVGYKK
jgi:hypothetical protein